jgi:hypothetical protein
MGGNHHEAELLAPNLPQLEAASKKAFAVVRLEYPDSDESSGYIVFRAGTRYTTDAVPPDFSGAVETCFRTKPTGIVLNRLRRVASVLKRVAPEFHDKSNVDGLVGEIERWAHPLPGLLDANSVVTRCMKELAEPGGVYDILDGATELLNALANEFCNYRIIGDEFQRASAVLAFFAIHPQPLILRNALGSWLSPDALSRSFGGKEVLFVPPMDLSYYLSHPSAISQSSFLTARGAARLFRRLGSESVQRALNSLTILEFHTGLYAALAHYRGALETLQRLKELGKHAPTLWSDFSRYEVEHHRWWVECEEARVNISAALREAALPRQAWNIAHATRMIHFAANLAEREGPREASKRILDICVRLVVPKFACDMLLAVVAGVSGAQLERHADRMALVVARLEGVLDKSAKVGEPPYLFYAYGIAGRLAEQLGRKSMAKDMARRQGGLHNHVVGFFGQG